MLAALLATAIASGPTASDFFPLVPGTRMTYEERSAQTTTTVDEVGQPQELAGVKVIPVKTSENGREIAQTFYKVEPTTISVVGYDAKNPLPSPLPVVKFGDPSARWHFEGPASNDNLAEPLTVDGEARLKGTRDVLGRKVEVLEVKLTSIVGAGPAREMSEQTALYGKGIGMIEFVSKMRVGKKTLSRVLRLVKLEEPKGSD